MPDNLQDKAFSSPPRRSTNDAAAFVENRIILPRNETVHTYVEELDEFVTREEAIRQQKLRYMLPAI